MERFNFNIPGEEQRASESSSSEMQVKKRNLVTKEPPALHIGGALGKRKRERSRPAPEALGSELRHFSEVFAQSMDRAREQADQLARAAQEEHAKDRAARAEMAREEREHQRELVQSCRMQ